MEQNDIFSGLRQAIIDGESEVAERLANKAVQAKMDPIVVIENCIRKALDIIGDGFRRQEIFLPELVMGAEAAMVSSAILEKELEKTDAKTPTREVMVIGTVAGDVHDIGKTLVATLFRATGFSVIDLGVNVATERFVDAVREYKCDLLGLSALLTTTVKEQRVVIDALEKAGLRSQVKIMVGGEAVTQDWAEEIGADAYGEDAAEAVEKGKRLMGLL